MSSIQTAFEEILSRGILNIKRSDLNLYADSIDSVITVSGAAALGKTSFSIKLEEFLIDSGYSTNHIELDGFLMKRDYRQKNNLSGYDPNVTDFRKLNNLLKNLLIDGKEVELPIYDHDNGTIKKSKIISPTSVIILDGIISQHYEIRKKYPAFKIFFEAKNELIMRGLRLLIDMRERNYTVYRALSHADNEVLNYYKWIHYQRNFADLVLLVGKDWELEVSSIA